MRGAGRAAAVRAFDEGGVERDDVHEHAEAEFLLQETPENFQFYGRDGWVEEQLDGVVAGLAMDIDATGEIGGELVIEPIIVGKPGVFFGDGDEVAGAGMVEAQGGLLSAVENLGDAGLRFEQGANFFFQRGVVEIYMRDLVVGNSEGFAGAAIEQFEAELIFDGEPMVLAQEAVHVDGSINRSDAVFGEEQDLHGALLEKVDQVADDGIDLPKVLRDGRVIGAEALEVVIEVRQINQAQAWGRIYFRSIWPN